MTQIVKFVSVCVWRGAVDSLKGGFILHQLNKTQNKAHRDRQDFQDLKKSPAQKNLLTQREEPRLLKRVIQCCGLNGFVFLLSIFAFNQLLLPSLHLVLELVLGGTRGETETSFWYWLSLFLKWTFDALWVLPLFLLSRIVNALWFQDIGSLAYRYSVGRPRSIHSMSTFIADNIFSLIIQALFLIQAMTLRYVPIRLLSEILFVVHMSLLYSFYSFEYKWIQMGWPLHQRLAFLEINWPYFLGFGLPLTLLTSFVVDDIVISGGIFAIAFPVFIIAANEAETIFNNRVPRLKLFGAVVSFANSVFNRSLTK